MRAGTCTSSGTTVRHDPWRDRNVGPVHGQQSSGPRSVMIPGGIATGTWVTVTWGVTGVRHDPWRDRNKRAVLLSRSRRMMVRHDPWRDRNFYTGHGMTGPRRLRGPS